MPLVQGKVKYGFLEKETNFDLIRKELSDRNISFPVDTDWMTCLTLLEKDENIFYPKTRSHKEYEENYYVDI